MASGDRANTRPDDFDLSESPSSPPKKGQGKKGKAGSSKKMTKKEQSERFIDTARKLGADESGKAFERAIGNIISPKD